MNLKSLLFSILLLVSLVAAADLSKFNLKANESYIYIYRTTSGSMDYPNPQYPDTDVYSTDWNYKTEILVRGYLKENQTLPSEYDWLISRGSGPWLVANYSLENATVSWSIHKISHLTSLCTNTNTVESSGTEKLENLQFVRDKDANGEISIPSNNSDFIPTGIFSLKIYEAELDDEGNPLEYGGISTNPVPHYEASTGFILPADVIWTTDCQPPSQSTEIYDPIYFFAPLIDPIPPNTNTLNGSMTVPATQMLFQDPRLDTISSFGFWETTLDEPFYDSGEDPLIWYVEWKMYLPNMPALNTPGDVNTPSEKNNTSGNTTGNNTDTKNNTNDGNNPDNDNIDPCVVKECTFIISPPGPDGTTEVIVSAPDGPVPDTIVTVSDPEGNKKKYTTNGSGTIHITFTGSGNYTISAGNKSTTFLPKQLLGDIVPQIAGSSAVTCSIILLIIIIVLVALYLRLRNPQRLQSYKRKSK